MSQRIEIPLAGGQYIGRSTDVDAQECINLYPVLNKSGGKVLSLQPVPGLKTWKDTGVEKETRATYKFSATVMYSLIGDTVYKFDTDGGYTTLSATLNNDAGPVQIVDNGVQIMILDLTDGEGYVIELDVLTKISDVDFPTASSLTYQDGYAIVSERGTKKFAISTLDTESAAAYEASDFTRWDTLEKATVTGLSDNLSAIFSDHDELWGFGSEQVGFFYNSANVDFPFTKTEHPFQEVGLGGTPSCIVKLDNSIFWIDAWNNVRKADGYTPVIISTPEISYNIEQFSRISDAIAFGYQTEGQAFYIITFPDADKTYCYDVLTQIWHLRSSGLSGGRWRANCYVKFGGKHLVGDYQSGIIYEMDHDLFTDAGKTFKATRTTRHTEAQRRRIIYHRLELHMKSGVGNVVDPGEDPQIMLKWSDDGGHTWSGEKWKSMGKIGKFKERVVWRKLGKSRDRIFKFEITDPVDRVLISLWADVTIGNN